MSNVSMLRAMARNYEVYKHQWDKLDTEACLKAANEIEQLQAKNAELTAEVERLKATPPNQRQDLHCVVSDIAAECRELRQQLTIAEEHAMRLREALANHSGNYKLSKAECAVINDLLDKPASRETLDSYVAEKVKEETNVFRIEFGDLHDTYTEQKEKISKLTKQRDLAVEALAKSKLMVVSLADAHVLALETIRKIKEN